MEYIGNEAYETVNCKESPLEEVYFYFKSYTYITEYIWHPTKYSYKLQKNWIISSYI
jgi:hypothetical protein